MAEFLPATRHTAKGDVTQIRLAPSVPGAPATRALVIGVGYYRHLLGGPAQKKRVHLGLSVLESPPRSAEKFANVLLGIDPDLPELALNNSAAPLTTVDVLVSGRNPSTFTIGGTTHAAEGATGKAVGQAFDRWLAEVEKHEDNVGILYFCGHGVMGNGPEQYLLLEDHGDNENRPFETGFDFTNTLRSLWRRVPAQLYLFIDACRTYDARVASSTGSGPGVLLDESASTENVNKGTTLIEASGEGLPAYGDSTQVSRFTDALVRALGGFCGVRQPGANTWLVNGEALRKVCSIRIQ